MSEVSSDPPQMVYNHFEPHLLTGLQIFLPQKGGKFLCSSCFAQGDWVDPSKSKWVLHKEVCCENPPFHPAKSTFVRRFFSTDFPVFLACNGLLGLKSIPLHVVTIRAVAMVVYEGSKKTSLLIQCWLPWAHRSSIFKDHEGCNIVAA